MSSQLSRWYQEVIDRIESQTTLSLATQVMDATLGPTTELQGESFGLLVDSDNTDKYRDHGVMRLGESVMLRFVLTINVHDQHATVKAALDVEEVLLAILLDPGLLPATRTLYRRSRRRPNVTHEYWVTDLLFDMEHDFTWSQ